MKYFFLFLLSYCLMVSGLIFIFLYINLLSFGYTIGDYLEFIITHFECDCFFIGFFLFLFLLWRL